jgi:hypothetical protein
VGLMMRTSPVVLSPEGVEFMDALLARRLDAAQALNEGWVRS